MNCPVALLLETTVHGPAMDVARRTFMGMEPVLVQENWKPEAGMKLDF